MLPYFAVTFGWADMFTLKLPVAEKILRPVIVYVVLIVLLRVFGKRELAQMNPFDLVVLLSISNTVQNAIIGDDNSLVGGLIGAAALLTINYVVVRFIFRHRRLDQLLGGGDTVLIKSGHIQKKALAKELISVAELTVVAHRQGHDSLGQIDRCVLEPGGVFHFIRKPGYRDPDVVEVLRRLDRIEKALGVSGHG